MLNFFSLALVLSWHEIQNRFAGSLLGGLWLFIWPLVQMSVYILVFGKLMGARLGQGDEIFSYGLYIASGLLAWTCFAKSLAKACSALIERSAIIRKVRISLPVLPAAACLTEILPFAAGFVLLFIVDCCYGWRPAFYWLGMVAVSFYCILCLAYGLGLFLGCIAVFSRDIIEMTGIVLQLAFWFTPIVYLPSILPQWLARLLWVNPMTSLTSVFQQCFVLGGNVNWPEFFYSAACSQCALLAGLILCHYWDKELRDVI